MNFTKQQLLDGECFQLTNEEHQVNIGSDDIRDCEVWFDDGKDHSWTKGFKIRFNGVLLHHSKTFKSFENRLNRLIVDWNLKQI